MNDTRLDSVGQGRLDSVGQGRLDSVGQGRLDSVGQGRLFLCQLSLANIIPALEGNGYHPVHFGRDFLLKRQLTINPYLEDASAD